MTNIKVKKGDALWSVVTTGINFGAIEGANMWGFSESGTQVAIYTVLDSGSPYTLLPAVFWDEIQRTFKRKGDDIRWSETNGKFYPNTCDPSRFPDISF